MVAVVGRTERCRLRGAGGTDFPLLPRDIFDVFGQIAVLEIQLRGDYHRDHIASTRQMGGNNLTLRIDD